MNAPSARVCTSKRRSRSLSVRLLPIASVEGRGIELRVPDRPDLPPFIAIDRFNLRGTPWHIVTELVRGHVNRVQVDGLKITIPPGNVQSAAIKQAAAARSHVIVDELIANDATLTVLRRKPGHNPLLFAIHALKMSALSFDQPIPFHAELTNAMPHGEIVSDGTVGPWQTQPSDLPLEGTYTFRQADLNDIKGIGGMLTSDGTYKGSVTEIQVEGQTNTPDFNLDLGGAPVPLATTFKAVVDGSNGTTHLESVDAVLYKTPIHVTGDVVNLPGPAGFNIDLKATIQHGRIEDLLTLAMKSAKPPFTGDMAMTSSVHVPAGREKVRDRLRIDGMFGLAQTKFTDGDIQRKLTELSRRGQGKDEDEPMSRVMTNLKGSFHLAARQLQLSDFTFEVPGATVQLAGNVRALERRDGLRRAAADEGVALERHRRVQVDPVKPFDCLFKRDGAGSVVPIRITGTTASSRSSVSASARRLPEAK